MGSVTDVIPSVNIPASRTADLTCALATGSTYSMGTSCVPSIFRGGKPPSREWIRAPICVSGSIMRRIGRLLKEASPSIVDLKSCPASIPAIMRIVDPELPASRVRRVFRSPSRPAPAIRTRSPSMSIFTPRREKQSSVLRQSAAAEKWVISLVPSARDASIAYRWEMDLSPGTSSEPLIVRAGRIICLDTEEF